MRIKLHNSIGKVLRNGLVLNILFSDINIVIFHKKHLYLRYGINDSLTFLKFNPRAKKLEKGLTFGLITKKLKKGWWKDLNWKEMDKEDENQIT